MRRVCRGDIAAFRAAQREAIELAYFEGLTDAEIATLTAVPIETVKRRMRVALRRLDEGADLMLTPAQRFLRGSLALRDSSPSKRGGAPA